MIWLLAIWLGSCGIGEGTRAATLATPVPTPAFPPVAGVIMEATNQRTGARWCTTTNADGDYGEPYTHWDPCP